MYQIVKRLFDIIASLIALIVLFPLFAIASIGIVIHDPGPVFYMANRVGKGNRVFKMLKFRSMKVDKSANEKNFKADTNRIFCWGAVMRATKIDELPQLINVLRGDMSVIGPRPASVDQITVTRAGAYAAASNVKPGLSGPSALYDFIYGDAITDENEYKEKVLKTRLDLDLFYLRNRSVLYDLKMISYTIVCVLASITRTQPQWIIQELIRSAETISGTDC